MTPEQKLDKHKEWLKEKIDSNQERIDRLNEDILYSKAWLNACKTALNQLNEGEDENRLSSND
jgi:hypothetical protein